MLEKLISKSINFLFPQLCLSCNKVLAPKETLFCEICLKGLPKIGTYCQRCGALLSPSLQDYFPQSALNYCSSCIKKPPPFERVFLGFYYKDPIKKLIHQVKFGGDFIIGYHLGKLLKRITGISLESYDLILPIPLSLKRERERGFNQSLLLIWGLIGYKFTPKELTKIKDTKPQSELSEKERWDNIKGAFYCKVGVSGKRILLVDDVMTTGATLREASKELKRAGAFEVHLLVLARA